MTSWACLMPARLFLRSYKFVRNPSPSGGGTALKGGFLAHSPLAFETKLPRIIFPLPDHLSVLLAQPEASQDTWLRRRCSGRASHRHRHTCSPQPVGVSQ